MINIKLDKCGGLTHSLEIARAAREKDLGLMVGCMCGTSLAMAPAFVVGLLCDFHDLDGPLLLKNDRAFGMSFENGVVGPPPARLWG
jgi:L-alanine-DL-glutamate epimerase-like enolase superfamily enzyme